jgi:hypothetical protein
MGYLAKITGQEIENVVSAGQGLAFVVYPYAVTTIPGAPIWSILFFFMMGLLGLDSTLGSIEVTIRSVLDFFPSLSKHRTKTITVIFALYFTCGLLFCFQSGTYWLEFFNRYAGDWSILVTALFEVIVIGHFYGADNLKKDIRAMLGDWAVDTWTWYIWLALWKIICPLIMAMLIVISWTQLKVLTLGEYEYPDWTVALGLIMTASVNTGVVGWAGYCVLNAVWRQESLWDLIQPDFERYVPIKEKDKEVVNKLRGYCVSGVSNKHNYFMNNLVGLWLRFVRTRLKWDARSLLFFVKFQILQNNAENTTKF